MSEFERMARIVARVRQATEAGELRWRAGERAAFSADLDGVPLEIISVDNDGIAPFEFRIRKESGELVERVRSVSSTNVTTADRAALNNNLEALYTRARAQGLGIDDVLADVERKLGI